MVTTPDVGLAARPVAQIGRKRPEPRPEPVRSSAFAHLSVAQLRELRTVLTEEESRVAYWRRILQGRLDALAGTAGARALDADRLAPVLSEQRIGAGRAALARFLPVEHEPPLPPLAQLWEQGSAEQLRQAEQELADYRTCLQARITEATTDLIARYRDEPALCLSALPSRGPAARG